VKKTLLILLVAVICVSMAFAQGPKVSSAPTARQAAVETGWKGAGPNTPITLALPHACTVSKSHPCVFYAGDLNVSDPNANGLSNENSLIIPQSFTYNELKAPVSAHITASFSNNLTSLGFIDPQVADWDIRTGISEGNGGTSIGSGTGPAMFTQTGRIDFSLPEYELLTKTAVTVPAGNVWFAIVPECTNANDPDCSSDARYFISTTDGTLNGVNTKFSVPSDGTNSAGPFLNSAFFGANFANWCTDFGICNGAHHPPAYAGVQSSFGVMK